MKTKSLISLLLAVLMICTAVTGSLISVSADDKADAETTETTASTVDEVKNPYQIAAQGLDKEYAYSGNDLGCTYTAEKTTWKVWAPTASKVTLNLYATGKDTEDGAENLGSFDMEKDMADGKFTGCYTITLEGDKKNIYYTYTVTNEALVTGKENTAKDVVDPYAKAVGVNGDRAMVVDLASTNPKGWEKDAHIYVDEQTEAIVWEVVVRDFSASESSGVSEANRGKFLAFTEKGTTVNGEGAVPTCVDYLKELGITHVQINPFYDFSTVNETADLSNQYNWGYDPKNYNVPEGSYSSNPYDGNVRINECKQMIQALHEAGIGVIMDVVYNHTYFSSTSNFQLIVPNYYYRMNAAGGWSNASGCSNDTASERAMYRKFMIDSCRYWAEEYHVDGFRFDLMGIHDAETMNLIRENLDAIDPRIIMYGEGWDASSSVFDTTTCSGTPTVSASQKNAMYVSERVAMFNDQIRDALKGNVFSEAGTGYLQGSKACYEGVAYGIRANTVGRGGTWKPVAASQCVTYSCCHDNHTLYDRLVTSVYGGNADYRQRYSDLIEMNKMGAGIVLTSNGISFLLAGEEMARTKDGDTNSYSSSVEENMIDWTLAVSNADLVSYYRGLIDIRKAFTPFTAGDGRFNTAYTFNSSLAGVESAVAYTVTNTTEGEWNKVAVIFNSMPFESQEITLNNSDVEEWVVIADNTTAGLDAIKTVKGNTFTVAPSGVIIAVDKESYEACGFESGDSKVVVNHVDSQSGKVLSTQVITGKIGNGYVTAVDSSLSLEYDFAKVEGDAKGTFAEGTKEVTYYYDLYKAPSLLSFDPSGDGKVSIKDATTIQKHVAGLITLTGERLEQGDYDYNKAVNVKDATLLQKHLAGMSVSIGKVVTNYYFVKDDGTKVSLAPTVEKKYRVGSEYTTSAAKVELYEASSKAPDNASGLTPAGITYVDYFYEYSGSGVKIHAIHLDETQTWTPYLWAWSGSTNAFKSWPGVAMMEDGDGWFSIDAALPEGESYSVIISNNGSPQSDDFNGVNALECWIVIDDYHLANKAPFIAVYEEKPDIDALRAEAAVEETGTTAVVG